MGTIPGISDHPIPVTHSTIRVQTNRKERRHICEFKKTKWEDYEQHLLVFHNSLLEQCNNESNNEDCSNDFEGALLKLMENYVPSRTAKCHQNFPWWNRHLKLLLRWKQSRYNKAKKTGNATTWAKSQTAQREMQKAFDKARLDYANKNLLDGLENNNHKPSWFCKVMSPGQCWSSSPQRWRYPPYGQHILFQRVFTQKENSPLPNPVSQSCPTIGTLELRVSGVAKFLSSPA